MSDIEITVEEEADIIVTIDTTTAYVIEVPGVSAASVLTTEGDLLGFSIIPERIPIGTNDQVLTVDTAELNSIKWADIPEPETNKIYQLNSSVEVIDTAAGNVVFTVDGDELITVKRTGQPITITNAMSYYDNNTPLVRIEATGTSTVNKGALLWLDTNRGTGVVDIDVFRIDNSGGEMFSIDNAGGVSINQGQRVDEISTDGTLAGNSDTELVTEKAIKTYVDTEVGEVADDVADINESRVISGYDLTGVFPLPTLSFTSGTRTFHVEVAIGESEYVFWCNSVKYTKTTTNNVVIPNVSGTYYIYFDANGVIQYVLESNVVGDMFYYYTITGLVYWNATAGTYFVGNEMHGKLMDGMTHLYEHLTFGARYEQGIDIIGLVDGTTTYTNTTVGNFWDEDIRHSITSQSTHPFLYKLGVDGEWYGTTADNNVGYKNGTSNVVFNEWNGSTWVLTESGSSTDYIIYFFIVTSDITGNTVKKIIGQNGYSSRNRARNAIEDEMRTITTDGLPSPEFVFLFAYIVRRNGDLEELADGSTYLDLRYIRGGAGGDSGTSTSPLTTKGDLYGFDTTDNRLPVGTDDYVLTADSTEALGVKWASAGAASSPLTTKGDIYVYSTTDVRLPIGTNDYILTADSAEATGMKWAAASSGFSDPTTTRGDIIYKNPSNTTTRLPAGTANQVLTSDGTDISWEDSAGGSSDKIEEGNSSVEVIDTGTGHVSTTIDGNEVVRIDPSTLRVGDGLDQSYSGDIFMVNDGGACVFGGRSFSTSALSAPRFEFGRVGGSLTTPASVSEGDRIGALNTLNYAGTGFQYTGGIFFINDGAPSGGVGPTKIAFETGTTNTASRTARLVIRADGCVEPGTDNSQDFGSSSKRWDDIYATNATIQTSDERMKRDIVDTTLGLDFITALTPKTFKWKDYNDEGYKDVEQYSEDGELLGTKKEHYKHEHKHLRKHHGLMAQEVEKVVKGLDKGNQDFAGIVYDEKTDTYGLRYNEFIAPLIKSIQELSGKNNMLEDRVEVLEVMIKQLLKNKGVK